MSSTELEENPYQSP